MICAQHDWWDVEAACPQCAPVVTAAETCADPGPDPDPGPDLSIPDFLLRNKDGSFAHPELMPCPRTTAPPAAAAPSSVFCVALAPIAWTVETITAASDLDLQAAVNDHHLTCLDRQPIYRELRKREATQKSRQRIAAMKAKKEAASCPS